MDLQLNWSGDKSQSGEVNGSKMPGCQKLFGWRWKSQQIQQGIFIAHALSAYPVDYTVVVLGGLNEVEKNITDGRSKESGIKLRDNQGLHMMQTVYEDNPPQCSVSQGSKNIAGTNDSMIVEKTSKVFAELSP